MVAVTMKTRARRLEPMLDNMIELGNCSCDVNDCVYGGCSCDDVDDCVGGGCSCGDGF